jgi:hypothetical protein
MSMDDNDEVLSTDEEIMANLESTDESLASPRTTEEDTGTAETAEETASPARSQQSAESSDGSKSDGKQTRGPQDLVNASGEVIAAGGRERRFYETAQQQKSRADELDTKVTTLTAQLEAINSAGSVGTQYNLTPEEVTTGAQLISSYKNNPVETIQYMLTQAQSNGINVDSILNGNGNDIGAIKQLIENAIAPLTEQRQEEIDTQAANDRATSIYNGFMSKYPDAAVHEDSLSRLLEQDSSLSVEAAYYKLQSYYNSKGLDWTKSLGTLQNEINATSPRENVNTRAQPPDGGVNTSNTTDTARVADTSTSTDDIIKEAMAEAGITA